MAAESSRSEARLFDMYVMVDWSASAVPKSGADSIWSAVLDERTGSVTVVNHPTRTAAREMLLTLLRRAVTIGARVLVGFDMPYGYPAGTAAALALPTDPHVPPWRAMWDQLDRLVVDDLDGSPNQNNRFAAAALLNARLGAVLDSSGGAAEPGPFWGCPAHVSTGVAAGPLSPRKLHSYPYPTATGTLAEFRLAEQALRARRLRPFSVWQLAGAGAVGSQVLMGVPVLRRLITDRVLAPHTHVWPFTTGLSCDAFARRVDHRAEDGVVGSVIVHAEIWPGCLAPEAIAAIDHPVKDARQVTALCRWAVEQDRAGALEAMFSPDLPPEIVEDVVEEGWVLGVGHM